MRRAVARACSNVALAKYWGKRDLRWNLPCTGSLSVTLAGLTTTAAVSYYGEAGPDQVVMNAIRVAPPIAGRVSRFLDLIRESDPTCGRAEVEIETNFPVAAGLASSASTFAALALAGTRAAGLDLATDALSVLARRGSGSAARSVAGGFVEWAAGKSTTGMDSCARQIASPQHWPLGVVVAITDATPKPVGSGRGMERSKQTSPFFAAWIASHEEDLKAVRRGVLERDLDLLGRSTERNCLKMHAVAMASDPPLLYWNGVTVAVMHRVARLREDGITAYFTIDAGPQVKVLCRAEDRERVAYAVGKVPGVIRVLLSKPGPDAELLAG